MTPGKSIFPPSGLDIPMPTRGVLVGGNVSGSSIVTGDRNTVTTHVALPPAGTVDVRAELASLRDMLARLNVPERGKLDRAMTDAAEEAAKPDPDKEDVTGALSRVAKAAKAADDFSEHVEKLAPRIAALASWLGPLGKSVLAGFGLSG